MSNILFTDDSVAISNYLIANSDHKNIRNGEGRTPLMVACEKGLIDVIDVLLSFDVDVNLQDYNGNTALHLATKKGRIDAILRLIAASANGLIQNDYLDTPLHIATTLTQSKLGGIIEILTLVSNFNYVNSTGDTPLMAGISRIKDINIILYMIEFTTNINQVNKYGETALSLAVARLDGSDLLITKTLIEKGADVNYVNEKDMSILEIAIQNNISQEMLELLMENIDVVRDYAVLIAIENQENYSFFELLLSKIKEIGDDYPILEEAIRYSIDDDIIFSLIEKGANVNALSYDNEPIIVLAFSYDRSYDLIKRLINYGADINTINEEGNSLLQMVDSSSNYDRRLIMRFLIKRGAKYFYEGNEYRYRFYTDDDSIEPYN